MGTEIAQKETLVMPEGRVTAVMPGGFIETEITVGTVLLGKYTLQEVLAENTGEARIYKARQGQELVAVKVYHTGKRPKDALKKILARFKGAPILTVIEEGELNGRYFEVIPFFIKGDLLKYAPLEEKIISEVVVYYVNEALHALHQEGVIHRDIKPGNLFWSDDERQVIVGDFGISSVIDERASVRMTSVSRTLGYAAPETAQGIVSKEADYYSFGITLLHLVTGCDPFAGMTDTQIIKATIADKLVLPDSIPPRIANLIRGLTVKERTERWGYQEVVGWLEGTDKPVADFLAPVKVQRGYLINNQEYEDFDSLAMALAANWGEALKHAARGFFSQYLFQFGQELASKALTCEETANKDLGLFKLIYLISPAAPLCWQGEVFQDIKGFGQALYRKMPGIKGKYLEFLTSSALLTFLQDRHYDQEIVEKVRAMQELAKNQPKQAYYQMFYLFSGSDEFFWQGGRFNNPDELLTYLYNNRNQIDSLAKDLLQQPGFLVWLDHLGFTEYVSVWQNELIKK